MSEDRFHRDDPLRADPVRNFSTTLRDDAWSAAMGMTDPPFWMGTESPGTEGPAAAGGSTAETPGGPIGRDFVLDSIRLSNELIRDQMQRGQEFAEQFAAGLGRPAADLRQIMERLLRSYSNMYVEATTLWLDVLFPLRFPIVPKPGAPGAMPGAAPLPFPGADLKKVWEGLLRSYANLYVDSVLIWLDLLLPKQPSGDSTLKPSTASAIPVTILSARPARGHLTLNPGAETQPLEACQLWSRDASKPPLLNASFQTGADGKPFLVVRVPDDQPADLYLGVVCNRTTGEPLGNLSVQIWQP